jgi:hypothetical protein
MIFVVQEYHSRNIFFLLLPLLPKRIELISCSNIVQNDEEYLSGDCPYSKPETIDITKAIIRCS